MVIDCVLIKNNSLIIKSAKKFHPGPQQSSHISTPHKLISLQHPFTIQSAP